MTQQIPNPRTSNTHPLQIDGFHVASGILGLTLAPGKKCSSAFGADWDRDLALDVQSLLAWEADMVISLTTREEMEEMRIEGLGAALAAHGIQWKHLGFPDGSAPSAEWWSAWEGASPKIHRVLEHGWKVVVHCRGGLERAATVAALLQLERGIELDEALRVIACVRRGAGPLPLQKAALEERFPPLDLSARPIRDCLLGGAIGDAMGAEMEFWSVDEILNRFPHGITELLPHDGFVGAVTDDTQMTLFLTEGLIRAMRRGRERGICHPPSVVHDAFQRWLLTQDGIKDGEIVWGLLSDGRLHARRAPGLTCLAALRAKNPLGKPAANSSKGCGTIMRTAPVAFASCADPVQLARECAALTHGNQTGQAAAGAFTQLLRLVANGVELEEAARKAADCDDDATRNAIHRALSAPRDGHWQTVQSLGAGWVAEEALCIAIYAGLSAESFGHGLQIAVCHSGDSDSTGAVAGNLLGLLFPVEVSNHPFAKLVECRDLIERLSRSLAAASSGLSLFPE